jgi:hypothetical protein
VVEHGAVVHLSGEQVLRYRARATHLAEKLPGGSFALAAWGGLQDTVPRSGVLSLHARVVGTEPASWEDPSLVQIWFRGADYIVPRADVGIFTLGTYPRQPEEAARLERLADEVEDAVGGDTLTVREVAARLDGRERVHLRWLARTGRVHIRWDARDIWLIPAERPALDPEVARVELARRYLHWFGPATLPGLARWTGVSPADARETWASIEPELVAVVVQGQPRFVLHADLEALRVAEPMAGVRLLPADDPFIKLDHELLVPDPDLRRRVLPRIGESPGYIPGAVLVDGEIAGVWQRQQRRVRIHPFARLDAEVRLAIEGEAITFPIAGEREPSVTWDDS